MAKMEQAVDVFKIIATEGLAGLWKWILDRIGDFQEMVMGEIREFISEKVIKAGIEWLIGILNPAAAFIKACEAIYNVVMFFVEKGKEIIEFVNSILDSVESILNGGVGAVADLIEGTLAKTIPLIINFLADLLGLGGISEKIKEIIGKIQAPVNKAIDAVIGGALKIGKKMFASLFGKGKKPENKQSPEEQKASNDVRAQVADRPHTKLARPVDGPEALSLYPQSIFAAHKEHGLHGLAVQPTGPGEFDVLGVRLSSTNRGKRQDRRCCQVAERGPSSPSISQDWKANRRPWCRTARQAKVCATSQQRANLTIITPRMHLLPIFAAFHTRLPGSETSSL